jgi:NAD(P)-dependent dehydrogenase (short-subunit alcohol dehydrogenase family)
MGLEMFSLDGKAALVTGASRGMGAAIALACAEAGAELAIAARSFPELEATAARVEAAGGRALPIRCDVTSSEDIARCANEALAGLGRIDVLVNNAGGPMFNAPFLATREEGLEKVINLNLTSVLRFCRRVGAHMVERGCGSIINIGSVATFRPWPALTAYGVAKAGVISLTQALAQEWGRDGVRVNAVSPGWIDTEINRAFTESSAVATIADDVPMGRWGETDDVAGVAVWLASDASSYVTGANIPVDGGLSVAVPEDWRSLRVERLWATSVGAQEIDLPLVGEGVSN